MKTERSRLRIVEATVRAVRRGGTSSITTQTVATEAGCAKGLVHYHFGKKEALWTAVVLHLADERKTRWSEAFAVGSPDQAIRRTWSAVRKDHESGTLRLMSDIVGTSKTSDSTIRNVTEDFVDLVSGEIVTLLERVGLVPTVPARQLGWTLALAAQGASLFLSAGVPPRDLEESYAATWVGILSMSQGA